MTWVLIGFLLLAAVGPVFWVLPSRSDRRRMRLRSRAMSAGVQVRMAFLPQLDAPPERRVTAGGLAREIKRECMMYRRPVSIPAKRRADVQEWRWVRADRTSDPAVQATNAPGWAWDPEFGRGRDAAGLAEDSAWWNAMAAFAEHLPTPVIAIECSAADVALGWTEQGEEQAADELLGHLEQLVGLQRQRFAQ